MSICCHDDRVLRSHPEHEGKAKEEKDSSSAGDSCQGWYLSRRMCCGVLMEHTNAKCILDII
jgi:hypothetical protein